MSLFHSMNIIGSAMTAERFRMNIALQNMANVNTTRTASGEPYRRHQVIFQERALNFSNGILFRCMTPPTPMPMRMAMS